MNLDFSALHRCILILKRSETLLNLQEVDSIEYDMLRGAVIKHFEIALEVCGKMLRKALCEYVANPKNVRELTFKDIIRHAYQRGLVKEVDSWFRYRNSRNDTTHEYGIKFVNEALPLIQAFIKDAEDLYQTLHDKHGK